MCFCKQIGHFRDWLASSIFLSAEMNPVACLGGAKDPHRLGTRANTWAKAWREQASPGCRRLLPTK